MQIPQCSHFMRFHLTPKHALLRHPVYMDPSSCLHFHQTILERADPRVSEPATAAREPSPHGHRDFNVHPTACNAKPMWPLDPLTEAEERSNFRSCGFDGVPCVAATFPRLSHPLCRVQFDSLRPNGSFCGCNHNYHNLQLEKLHEGRVKRNVLGRETMRSVQSGTLCCT